MSLLSGDEIKSAGLIGGANADSFRASTYDLTVGEIIPGGKKAKLLPKNGEYQLKPGGMVRVIARESLKLPDSITGHALPRNTLCTKGVLAINIGIVDPGFHGPISSTLINFGSAPYPLVPGTPFLRVSFHRCHPMAARVAAETWEREKYVENAKQQVLAYSGSHFLNLDETVSLASKEAFGHFRAALIVWAAVAAVVLAVITVLVPLGASFVDRHFTDRRQWEAETKKEIELKLDVESAAQINALQQQIQQLKSQMDSTGHGRASSTSRSVRQ